MQKNKTKKQTNKPKQKTIVTYVAEMPKITTKHNVDHFLILLVMILCVTPMLTSVSKCC